MVLTCRKVHFRPGRAEVPILLGSFPPEAVLPGGMALAGALNHLFPDVNRRSCALDVAGAQRQRPDAPTVHESRLAPGGCPWQITDVQLRVPADAGEVYLGARRRPRGEAVHIQLIVLREESGSFRSRAPEWTMHNRSVGMEVERCVDAKFLPCGDNPDISCERPPLLSPQADTPDQAGSARTCSRSSVSCSTPVGWRRQCHGPCAGSGKQR